MDRTRANICINLILPETTFLGLHFMSLTVYGYSSANFQTVLSESRGRQPMDAEPKTDFNAKWPFKVIYFGISEESLSGYIAQYNKCGLRC